MDPRGLTILNKELQHAAAGGDLPGVKELVARGANDLDSALVEAAQGGYEDVARYLIEAGTTYYDEPMVVAAHYGHIGIVQLMIEVGATDYHEAIVAANQGSRNADIIDLLQQAERRREEEETYQEPPEEPDEEILTQGDMSQRERSNKVAIEVRNASEATKTKWENYIKSHFGIYGKNFNRSWYKANERIVEKHSTIRLYPESEDSEINSGLRTGNLSLNSYKILVEIITALNESKPYPVELILFRGVEEREDFPISTKEVGDLVSDPAIMSKSRSFDHASQFAGDTCCMLIIVYPPGMKQIYFGMHGGEDEYIGFPGEIFRILDIFQTVLTPKKKARDLKLRNLRTLVLNYEGNLYQNHESEIENMVNPDIS